MDDDHIRTTPKPTTATPGSVEKVNEMRRRFERGEELFHAADSLECREEVAQPDGKSLSKRAAGVPFPERLLITRVEGPFALAEYMRYCVEIFK